MAKKQYTHARGMARRIVLIQLVVWLLYDDM